MAGVGNRARALREAFDRSFASPHASPSRTFEDFLSVRIAGDPYAIRARDIDGVVARRPVVSVPAAAPGLLGVAGIRSDIVPVFGLSSFLGYGEEMEAPRWLVLNGIEEPIALGFSDLEGYLRLPASAIHADDEKQHSGRRYVEQVAATETGARPILGIRLVVATIRERLGQMPRQKEQ